MLPSPLVRALPTDEAHPKSVARGFPAYLLTLQHMSHEEAAIVLWPFCFLTTFSAGVDSCLPSQPSVRTRLCGAFACCLPGTALNTTGNTTAVRRGSQRKSATTTAAPAAAAAAVGDGTLRFRNAAVGRTGSGSAATVAAATARSSLLEGGGGRISSSGGVVGGGAGQRGYSALSESEGIVSGGRGANGAPGGEWDPV